MRSNVPLRVALYDPSGKGGICHYTFQLAEGLTQAGCDVTVMAPEGYELNELPRSFKLGIVFKKSLLKGWLVKIMPRLVNGKSNHIGEIALLESQMVAKETQGSPVADFLRALRLRIILTRAVFYLLWDRPHLIHFQWLVDRKCDFYFIKLLKWFRFKIVYTAHDLLPHEKDTTENRRLFRKIYQLADRVIVHAETNKKEMLELFEIDPIKIHVIPHGSNDLFYTQTNVSKEVARKELDLPGEKRLILFFGLIKRYKGLEYLVEAFQEIKESVNNAMLLIVGKIVNEDAGSFKFYSRLLDGLSSRDDVFRRNEYVPFEKVSYYFTACDVVVLPYTETHTSGVLLLAYAAGRPVIVTKTGGLSDAVEDGKSGFVVPPKNAKALAQAIIKSIQSSDQLQGMGSYAKHLAETTYSWRRAALQTADVYRSLLTR